MPPMNEQNSQERKIPSWEKDPSPMEGWSVEEQEALIQAISMSPRDLRHPAEHRQLIFARLIRSNMPLRGRTLSECEACYAHIRANRIAYFGPTQHKKRTAHHATSSAARPER